MPRNPLRPAAPALRSLLRNFLLPALALAAFLATGCVDRGPLAPHELPDGAFGFPDAALGSPDASLGPPPPAAVPGEVRVLTRNLYLGGDIGPILAAQDLEEAAAAARGLDYEVVVRQPNIQVALPVPIEGTLSMVGYEDSDAILVRKGIPWTGAAAGEFQARPPEEVTAGISFVRGWTRVDAEVGGRWVRFVNTHLEIQEFRPVQEAQTAELLALLEASPLPVILVGDFNSAANPSAPEDRKTGSYAMIHQAGFFDLWDREGDPDGGLTCCHDPDLANATAQVLDQRLDIIFVRSHPGGGAREGSGFPGGSFTEVVGAAPGDRFLGSLEQPLWPSDHAGVAASVLLPPARVAGGG